ncbi:hypothetical protein EBZ38_02985 [bacterium]|nr:hypothetical protein [bacterium]
MSEVLRSPITNNAVLLIPRSGSNSLAAAAMQMFWPDIKISDETRHPATFFYLEEWWDGTNQNISIVVRNPIERFRSMCAHRPEKTLQEHLNRPVYGPLPIGNFIKYFRFEDELEECAKWLGLSTPIPHINASRESNKPILTEDQEALVRQIYADDIALWESLQPSV